MVADRTVFARRIVKSPKTVRTVLADGVYDSPSCRKYLYDKGLKGCIAPRRFRKIREEAELGERIESTIYTFI